MRLLTWNIQNGGGPRIPLLIDAIAKHAPDTVVLTEFWNGPRGNEVSAGLRTLGLVHQNANPCPPEINTVLIASKMPFTARTFGELNEHGRCCLLAEFECLRFIGVYFPQEQKKRPVFDFLLALPDAFRNGNALLIGDFNTGKHYIDEKGKTFHCADCIDKLEVAGWTDVRRRRHPNTSEYTWVSSKGNGFRLDHAYASAAIVDRITDVRYSHDERISKTSDHSILLMDIGLSL